MGKSKIKSNSFRRKAFKNNMREPLRKLAEKFYSETDILVSRKTIDLVVDGIIDEIVDQTRFDPEFFFKVKHPEVTTNEQIVEMIATSLLRHEDVKAFAFEDKMTAENHSSGQKSWASA